MNEELRKLVIAAGAPAEVMNQLWFHMFCQQFAHVLLTAAEEEINR